jgi:DNA-binding protein H-NS
MAVQAKLTDKQVSDLFSGLNFERQMAVLDSLGSIHGTAKGARIAELKAELAKLEKRVAKAANGKSNGKSKPSSIKPKYRDPVTGETWSGRGRMSNWLAVKVKAGDKVTKYLVK